MKKILIPVLLLGSLSLSGQIRNDEVFELPEMEISDLRNDIRIPDVDGFHVLKCDFHTHTIFSDGRVWPTMRVDEAWKDGLDAIAITDHIEVRPWKPFVSGGDLNSSFDIAKQRADQIGFIVIKGIEITRAKPLGHINALFITDANPIETPEPLDAVNEAYRQGAFIMWNHPGWPDDRCTMYDVHEQLIKEGKIHGVEVFNSAEYYPKAIDWCRDLAAELGFKRISVLTPAEHDHMIGYVSQLCHAIAVSLMCASDNSELANYTGDSFRDLTRIAHINDKMWAELFLWNKDNLISEIDMFESALQDMREKLVRDDREGLEEMFRLSTKRREAFDKK